MRLNAIQIENQRPGIAAWQLTNPVLPDDFTNFRCPVEGYASSTSVVARQTIDFYVSSRFSSVTGAIYRMGWYGGAGGRLVKELPSVSPGSHGLPSSMGAACAWPPVGGAWSFEIPPDWQSGVYLLKLSGSEADESSSCGEAYIVFIVRAASPSAKFLMQLSTANWQAYNQWGGSSYYNGATSVSFKRPYQPGRDPTQRFGSGAGQFLTHGWTQRPAYRGDNSSGLCSGCFGGWEYNMVRWLEREGYDVSYCASGDLETLDLSKTACVLSVGHDEYWSGAMVKKLKAAIASGTSVAFFSGNSVFREVTFTCADTETTLSGMQLSGSTIDGVPGRMSTETTQLLLGTRNWTANYQPDAAVPNDPHHELELKVQSSSSPSWPQWLLAGTQLGGGSSLGYLGGHEINADDPAVVAGIAHMTPVIVGKLPAGSNSYGDNPYFPDGIVVAGTFAKKGQDALGGAAAGGIFNAGTVMWAWALDDFIASSDAETLGAVSPRSRASYVNPAVQQISRNALRVLSSAQSRLLDLGLIGAVAPSQPLVSDLSESATPWSTTSMLLPGNFSGTSMGTEMFVYDAPLGRCRVYAWNPSAGFAALGTSQMTCPVGGQIIPMKVSSSSRTHILFYDPTLGQGQVFRCDASNNSMVAVGPLMTGWPKTLKIIPGSFVNAPGSQLLFYEFENGVGSIYSFDEVTGLALLGPVRPGWRQTWQVVPLSVPGYAFTCFLLYDPTVGEAMLYHWDAAGGEASMSPLWTGWRRTWNIVPTHKNDQDGAVLFHDTDTGELYCFKFVYSGGSLMMQDGWTTAGPATLGAATLSCSPVQIVPGDFRGTGAGRDFYFYLPVTPIGS